MKKILFTGGTGFIGRNILSFLDKDYEVYSPKRAELNLLDENAVYDYLEKHNFDVIIHTAIPGPGLNKLDINENLCEDSLRVFMNFYNLQKLYKKMIYFGSGAEYDKTHDIIMVKETEIGRSIPKNAYGLAKFIMNELARKSDKIYNLRIFGCYGPTDADFKFITNMIHDCMYNDKLTIRQNCFFDFLFVKDLVPIICHFIEQDIIYNDYNVCTGKRKSLYEIAEEVQIQMKTSLPIEIMYEGLNNEYTGDNSRLIEEFPNISFTPLSEGVQKLINEIRREENEKKSS